MEVLIRWKCTVCRRLYEARCPVCRGAGYLQRWIPFMILRHVNEAVKNPVIIMGRRDYMHVGNTN